jgi:hypothetical protein
MENHCNIFSEVTLGGKPSILTNTLAQFFQLKEEDCLLVVSFRLLVA